MLTLQLLVLALATGGVFAAMILGHWYLVTPKLPEGPLVMVSQRLVAVVALQVALFVAWVGARRRARRDGRAVRGAVRAVGPVRLAAAPRRASCSRSSSRWAAVQTARTRSMESATGLLYINVGTIAAGTIVAAGLYFGAGLLV